MSFFNNLLESSGCNPDGSIGQNPLTSFVEKSFEFFPQTSPDQQFNNDHTHFLIQQQPQQAGDPHYQDGPVMSSAINVGPMMFPPSAPHHHHQPLLNPSHQPYYPPPSYYPMPFPQQHMIPPQYMQQAPMPLTQQPQPLSQPQQPQLSSEAERQVDVETDKYARFQEIIRAANRDLNKTNWTILDDEEDDRLDSDNTSLTFPSKQGYQQAWDSLERKLTSGELSGERQYQYEEANPFFHSTTVNDVTALYEEALRHYEEGDVNLAVLKLEAIVQKDNNGAELAEVWRLLGTCHAENDDEPKAIYCLEKAVDYDPYHLSTLLSLGTCYVNELDSIKALETLRTWVTNNPKFLGLEVTHDEYSDGTLMDEVMQLILSVAAHSPDDAEVQVLLGVLYNISQDFDSALDCFHKALESSQSIDYNLLNKLGATLANSNRSAQALPYYSKALEQRPKFVRGWRNLGIAHANSNDYEPAAKAYLQALHLNPGARHIWSYVRVVLTCMERMDLVELSTKEDVRALAQALDTQLI